MHWICEPIIGCVPTEEIFSENSNAPDKLWVSDNPNDFNNAIHLLINNAQLRQRIALNGQLLIKKHFSQKTVIRQLNEIIKWKEKKLS